MSDHIYFSPEYIRFEKNLINAGYAPYHYRGRFYYEGPAVNCSIEDIDAIKEIAGVPCQVDDMGLGAVIYPK